MASVASQLKEEITAHAQSESLEDAREICAEGTYFTNGLCKMWVKSDEKQSCTKSKNIFKNSVFLLKNVDN